MKRPVFIRKKYLHIGVIVASCLIVACGFKIMNYRVDTVYKNYHKSECTVMSSTSCFTKSVTTVTLRDLKYILLWSAGMPFQLLRPGQSSFIINNCKFFNCFITYDKEYLDDLKKFDAVVFAGCNMPLENANLPAQRSQKQKYIYANIDPSPMFPVYSPVYDNFFNWTWTYRLSSDIEWKYFRIYDRNGKLVGPSIDIKWGVMSEPIGEELKKALGSKTKAAVWLVSHCRTSSKREEFVKRLVEELNLYELQLDVFGECTENYCARKSLTCKKMLRRNYYFYLSFENSFEEDYVSEKIMNALNNVMVPIVYGGANYSRFLPPGSYLNARELGANLLARKMNEAIRNLSIYHDFFRWRNYYEYRRTDGTEELCNLCTALNNETMVNKVTEYKKFREWWNGRMRQVTSDFLLAYFLNNKQLLIGAAQYNYTDSSKRSLYEMVKNQLTANAL